MTAPPGRISKATAAAWAPELRAAAAGYGLIPAADPSPVIRQVHTSCWRSMKALRRSAPPVLVAPSRRGSHCARAPWSHSLWLGLKS